MSSTPVLRRLSIAYTAPSQLMRLGLLSLCLAGTSSLQGCALPNAGPSAQSVTQVKGVDLVWMTAERARKMSQDIRAQEDLALNTALTKLEHAPALHEYRLAPGDMVSVSLWSFATGGAPTSETAGTSAPQQTRLGDFQVDMEGTISLPYAGRTKIEGMTTEQARSCIASRFRHLGVMHGSDVTISSTQVQNGIEVTGMIGSPKILSWNPGGLSLSRAITLALGDGSSALGNAGSQTDNDKAITATIIRQSDSVLIPINEALTRTIPLRPADKIIIDKAPVAQVTVIGGGITRNGLYGFSENPSLASTIARASGLNPNAANRTRIFVFRQDASLSKPTLYVFSWAVGEGLVAAQRFIMKNRDIVYVAESPIVPISRVINTIFQLALPATIAR